MLSNHLIFFHSLLFLPSIFPRITGKSFPVSRCFPSGGRSIAVSASASVLSVNIQGWFPLGLTGLISLQSKGLLDCAAGSFLWHWAFFMVQLLHLYMNARKTIALTIWTFVSKVMSLFFNMLPRFVIAFLPRSRLLLISSLQSPSTMILEPKQIVYHCFHYFPIYLPWSDGTMCHDLHFLNFVF